MRPVNPTQLKIQNVNAQINSIANHSNLTMVFGSEAQRRLNALQIKVGADERTLRLTPSVLESIRSVLEEHQKLTANLESTSNQKIVDLKRRADFVRKQLSELGV